MTLALYHWRRRDDECGSAIAQILIAAGLCVLAVAFSLGLFVLLGLATANRADASEPGDKYAIFKTSPAQMHVAGTVRARIAKRTKRVRKIKVRHHAVAAVARPHIAHRPPACPPRAWCGCYLAHYLGIPDRALWLARNWARVGSPAPGPAPGVIAVWRHHVGVVTSVAGPGRIVLLSGNDGRAVRERERSTRGVIAWRYAGMRREAVAQ